MRKVIIALIGLLIIIPGISCAALTELGQKASETVGQVPGGIEQNVPDTTKTAEQPLVEPADIMDRIEKAIRESLHRLASPAG